jgi:hypothetical protein
MGSVRCTRLLEKYLEGGYMKRLNFAELCRDSKAWKQFEESSSRIKEMPVGARFVDVSGHELERIAHEDENHNVVYAKYDNGPITCYAACAKGIPC